MATKDRLCELEKKLKQLKEMTYINGDKNIKDIRYTIFSTSENEQPELYCNVTWNEKNLKGIIKNLKVRTGLYTFGREKGLVLRDNNGRSYINNHSYSMYIPEKNQKEYGRISSELLDDKFIKGFVKEGLLFAKDNVDMSIVPNSVNIKMLKDYLISFYYYPGEKRAELMAKKELNYQILYYKKC